MSEELRNAKELVEEILTNDTFARNSDMWLILKVWEREGMKIDWNAFKLLTNPESIIRMRATIQNDELRLLPTDVKVILRRKLKEIEVREYFKDNKAILEEYETELYGLTEDD